METVVERSRSAGLKTIEFVMATNTADHGISVNSDLGLGLA